MPDLFGLAYCRNFSRVGAVSDAASNRWRPVGRIETGGGGNWRESHKMNNRAGIIYQRRGVIWTDKHYPSAYYVVKVILSLSCELSNFRQNLLQHTTVFVRGALI